MSNDEQLRYPIGKVVSKPTFTREEVDLNITRIEQAPARIEVLALELAQAGKLDKTYRTEGWTARQVIHHLADSHMNAYIRSKWMLTEETPTIKAYDEKAWALTAEVSADPLLSIQLLKALHAKWVTLLKAVSEADLSRQFIHPESKKHVRLDQLIATYAWHGEHHEGHLKIIASH